MIEGFTGNTRVITRRGNVPISEIRAADEVLTAAGTFEKCELVARDGYRMMKDMGGGELVTFTRKILSAGEWVNASEIFKGYTILHMGSVYDIHTLADHAEDTCFYVLGNGTVALGVCRRRKLQI